MNKDTFCVAPFMHQSTKTDGSIKACCRSLPAISNIKDESLLEAWNNADQKQLRLDLINGVRNKRCDVCWKLEDNNVRSLRQKYNDKKSYHKQALKNLENMQEDGTLKDKPTFVEFKLSNLCNFKCRMCHPMDSTKWFDDYKKISHLHNEGWQDLMTKLGLVNKPLLGTYNESFFETLPEVLSQVQEVWFAGGEPLYDDNHYRILNSIMDRAENINLLYASNLSMLANKKYNVIDYWKKFNKVQVSVSLDGPPKLNEYIRSGADSQKIQENINYLVGNMPNVLVAGKITVQALNIFYIPETLEWFRSMKVDNTDMHFVHWPDHLDARLWTGEAREKIIEKLSLYIDSLKTDEMKIKTTAINVLNYFKAEDVYTQDKWNKFIEWNTILDESRKESFNDFEFLQEYMNG